MLFPLSGAHYFELYKNRQSRQRVALAGVMRELSGFSTLISRVLVWQLELASVLAGLTGRPSRAEVLPLLGHGIAWAFGLRGLRIMHDEEDVTETFRTAHPQKYADAISAVEWSLLTGPTESDLVSLNAVGWDPLAAIHVAEKRAQQEREQALRFDQNDRWRRGRLRDAIIARELSLEWIEQLNGVLTSHGLRITDVMTDRDGARRLVRAMPSNEVAIELKTAAHRNPQHNWTANDITDIDAMALAVPYCDVVVTEKHAWNALRAAHLDRRMNTVILRRLEELPEHLAC